MHVYALARRPVGAVLHHLNLACRNAPGREVEGDVSTADVSTAEISTATTTTVTSMRRSMPRVDSQSICGGVRLDALCGRLVNGMHKAWPFLAPPHRGNVDARQRR